MAQLVANVGLGVNMIPYVKLGIAAAALLGSFWFGHSVAESQGEADLMTAKAEFSVERENWADERVKFEQERTSWANQIAELNAQAVKAMQEQIAIAAAKEKRMREEFARAEQKYNQRIKELENARKQADTIVADTSPTGGLWAQIDAASCTAGSGSSTDVPQARNPASGAPAALHCRLATPVAQTLVQMMDDSDKKVELLNRCIDRLNAQVTTFTKE